MARDWVARTTQHSFIEPALHNDSSIGDPPTAIFGKGLFEHVSSAGRNLGISVHTAKFHVAAVLEKLGARNRADAVAIVLRDGLVTV